jgi:hypothetical protein
MKRAGVDPVQLPQGQLDDGLFSAHPEKDEKCRREYGRVCGEGSNHERILNVWPGQVETESYTEVLD